jgi:HAD superfamily, subfamily IIIB (Acid phosphatase)
MNVYICDIDGTIADNKHREHFVSNRKYPQWDEFFEACDQDTPIEHMRALLADLDACSLIGGIGIIYVTGRPERVRAKTVAWLDKHDFPAGVSMLMRADGDHRPDHVIKKELLKALRDSHVKLIMAFDDRQAVVDMWRAMGVPCAQVAPSFD